MNVEQPELAPAHALQAEAWSAKAVALNYDLEATGQATQSALQAIRQAPDLAAGHFALGLAHRAAGRPEEALGAFRRAVELGGRAALLEAAGKGVSESRSQHPP